jgi:hypothetical protein
VAPPTTSSSSTPTKSCAREPRFDGERRTVLRDEAQALALAAQGFRRREAQRGFLLHQARHDRAELGRQPGHELVQGRAARAFCSARRMSRDVATLEGRVARSGGGYAVAPSE